MNRAPFFRTALLVCTLALACAASPAAAAGLLLCNKTSYVLYAATGAETGGTAKTVGWTRVVPGSCRAAIATPLGSAAYSVYAHSAQAHDGPAHAWGGSIPLCVKDTDFSLVTPSAAARCNADGAFAAPFAAIDTRSANAWTTTFTQSPPLDSFAAARQAGLARLLRDAGYTLGPGSANSMEAALNKFRTQMKLPEDAPVADLFDALETEALKVAAPAGYSICNDTDAPLWAALGVNEAKTWISRGWWKVEPGVCARAIATALATPKIYLRVERADGLPVVTGKDEFCVTNIQFEIERRSHCKHRGLTAAGFAATNTRGQSGYAAHVAEDGLLPPPRLPH